MRGRAGIGLLLLAVIGLVAITRWPVSKPPSTSPVTAEPTPTPAPAPVSIPPPEPLPPAPPPATSPPTKPPPPLPPDPNNPARVEAEAIALDLRHFGQRFGGNPVGTNAEIVHTLTGGNPKGVRYLSGDHVRLNDQGELIDSWGTPYFFHSLSSTETEIRSAGPDKTLWTSDDIAVK